MPFYINTSFNLNTVRSYARQQSLNYYWKVYLSENLIRVIIHSVLYAQVGNNWWNSVVDNSIIRSVNGIKRRYNNYPQYIPLLRHNIYFSFLPNLEKILFDNKGFFYPITDNTDNLIIGLNKIKMPRNLIGHMNILLPTDKRIITNFTKLCVSTIDEINDRNQINLIYP